MPREDEDTAPHESEQSIQWDIEWHQRSNLGNSCELRTELISDCLYRVCQRGMPSPQRLNQQRSGVALFLQRLHYHHDVSTASRAEHSIGLQVSYSRCLTRLSRWARASLKSFALLVSFCFPVPT